MSNVVALKARTPKQYLISDDVMFQIRMKMHHWRAADLAEAAGVCEGTIYGIRCGRTRWPRGSTLFPIIEALGMEVTLIDARTRRPI